MFITITLMVTQYNMHMDMMIIHMAMDMDMVMGIMNTTNSKKASKIEPSSRFQQKMNSMTNYHQSHTSMRSSVSGSQLDGKLIEMTS